MRGPYWHAESECLFESLDAAEIEKLRRTMELEDVTDIPEWEARYKEQNAMMTDEQFDKFMKVVGEGFGRMNSTLRTMAESFVQIEHDMSQMVVAASPSPDYFRPISEFAGFDWASIGASVVDTDRDGVSTVEWKGRLFTRRRGNADFEPMISFTRCTGKQPGTDKNQYERLIRFKEPAKAKRLPEETKELAAAAGGGQPAGQSQQGARPAPQQQPQPASASGNLGGGEFKCSQGMAEKLTRAIRDANSTGVKPADWKPAIKKVLQTDDVRSLNDADAAKALSIINRMAAQANTGVA